MDFWKPPEDGTPVVAMRLLPPYDVGFKTEFVMRKTLCLPSEGSKFGFSCPFCEMLLDRYPEDRGEGGIE